MEFPGEKLVIKLWETLAEKGIGSLLVPGQMIREGKARNEVRRAELLMLAQAEVDAAEIRAGRKYVGDDGTLRLSSSYNQLTESTSHSDKQIEPLINMGLLALNSASRKTAQDARKEINVSKAIIHAEDILANDSQVPPERTVEDDWLFAWQEYAGRVSTEDLQQLWGKILAGEVKSPGTHSIRTLDFLKGISKSEAEQISKLAEFVIKGRIFRDLEQYLKDAGLSFDSFLVMQELGILSGVESIGLETNFSSVIPDRFICPLVSNGKVLVVTHEDAAKSLKMKVYLLTTVGRQLLELGSFKPNVEYLRLTGKEILKQGFTVELADYVQVTEDRWLYLNAEKIVA